MNDFNFFCTIDNGLSLQKGNEYVRLSMKDMNELIIFFAEHFGIKEYEEFLQVSKGESK